MASAGTSKRGDNLSSSLVMLASGDIVEDGVVGTEEGSVPPLLLPLARRCCGRRHCEATCRRRQVLVSPRHVGTRLTIIG